MSTIQDVAKRAGVSVATVSRVLNDNGVVSEKRRASVLEAIKELKYKPNMAGRILRRARTNTILLTFSVLVPEFINGVIETANSVGFDVLFSFAPVYIKNPKPLKPLFQGLADGVIMQDVMLDTATIEEIRSSYPMVCCGGVVPLKDSQEEIISIDNENISYQMTKHLLDKGRKKIAAVGIRIGGKIEPVFSREREMGVRRALESAGMVYDPHYIYRGDVGYQTGRDAVESFINLDEMPDAIFCFNDKIAIGCISALKEKGIRVPEDIYVAGFDNLGITAQYDPPISTVAQPFYDMGRMAVNRLIAQMQDYALPNMENIGATLVLRKSTGD